MEISTIRAAQSISKHKPHHFAFQKLNFPAFYKSRGKIIIVLTGCVHTHVLIGGEWGNLG